MNKLSILLQKEVLLALGAIVFVGAVVASGTGAFFSSQASATANVFTAGTLTLKIAKDSNGTPVNGWLASQAAPWNLTALTPGGTPEESAVWLKNEGSVDGMTLGVAMDNAAATVSGTAAQMRITEMTLGGNSLLEGGAGAVIPEYEAPSNCTVTIGGSITAAIAAANPGDVICAPGTNYSAAWEGVSEITVNKAVTIASVNGPDNTSSIGFNVVSDNVVIRGFNIVTTQPDGIVVDDADGVTVEHNTFNNFGNIAGTANTQAIYLVNGSSNALVQYNKFDGVRSGTKSVKAIYVGHTGGTPNANNIEISNNIIENVESDTKGGYGIMVNAAGATTNLVIKNNTLANIDGNWMHAIGLEGNTPGAIVSFNTFSGLTATGADKTAVFFESNPSASSVLINQNNFEVDVLGVALHPVNQAGVYTIDATNNWWGDFDSSDQVFENNSTVNTAPIAGGPIAGLINGSDFNSNGYADLQDLNNDPILNAGVGLDAGEQKQFVMAVQLDGPTTGNEFQGASLTTDLVFTLNQI